MHYFLAIETSCDETSASVVGKTEEGVACVLSNVVASQIEIHRKFGGVVPEIASRNHVVALTQTVDTALSRAGITLKNLSAIGVTYGAGLLGALLTGVSYAKTLAYSLNIPLIGVNHIQAHIASNFLSVKPPFVCLVVSGGHTMVTHITSYFSGEIVKQTLDDAVGEAFDKVARVLGLPYPGGPEIDRLAKQGSACINFFKHSKGIDTGTGFSYSGLKTAVINYIHNAKQRGEEINIADVCASFQHSALEPLVKSAEATAKRLGLDTIAVAGGVSANSYLRQLLQQSSYKTHFPPFELCTDNAAMVGIRTAYDFFAGKNIASLNLNATSSLPVF